MSELRDIKTYDPDKKSTASESNLEIYERIQHLVMEDQETELSEYLKKQSEKHLVSLIGGIFNRNFSSIFPKINAEQVLSPLVKFAMNNFSWEKICHILAYYTRFCNEQFPIEKRQEALVSYVECLKESADNNNRSDVILKSIKKFFSNSSKYINEIQMAERYHYNSMYKPLSELEAKILIEKIQGYILENESTEIKTKDQKHSLSTYVSPILQLIKEAKTGTYKACLEKIIQLANDYYSQEKHTRDHPAGITWYWQHLNIGRIRFHYETQPSDEAHRLLRIAQIANALANKYVDLGGSTEIDISKSPEIHAKIFQKVTQNRVIVNTLSAQIMRSLKSPGLTPSEFAGLEAALISCGAVTSHVGNCSEKSQVVMEFLSKLRSELGNNPNDFRAELFGFKGLGHVFIVLGRDPDSDPSDYTTWGPNAVVCDPWKNLTFFSRDIPKMYNSFHPYRHGLRIEPESNVNTMKFGRDFLRDKEAKENKSFSSYFPQPERKKTQGSTESSTVVKTLATSLTTFLQSTDTPPPPNSSPSTTSSQLPTGKTPGTSFVS